METEKLNEFLYELLETEEGGVKIYEAALQSAQEDDLKEEWEKYHEQTKNHVDQARQLLEQFGLDSEKDTPGRKVLRHIAESLVKAIEMAREAGDPDAAEIVAAECVELAESKDHHNWELLGMVAEKLKGDEKKMVMEIQKQIEDEEDEHYFHRRGWGRELHLQALGLKAVLPPPEEKKDVKTATAAARAEKAAHPKSSRKTGYEHS